MANRQLSESELKAANKLLRQLRDKMQKLAKGDESLFWAQRRKVYKELAYDERGKPMMRKNLKFKKWKAQKGHCALCGKGLPDKGAILDRTEAMLGYTEDNTRLLCPPCDTETQTARKYA